MSESLKADLVSDIVIPIVIILALFAVNALVFAYIWRQRKHNEAYLDNECGRAPVAEPESDDIELAQL